MPGLSIHSSFWPWPVLLPTSQHFNPDASPRQAQQTRPGSFLEEVITEIELTQAIEKAEIYLGAPIFLSTTLRTCIRPKCTIGNRLCSSPAPAWNSIRADSFTGLVHELQLTKAFLFRLDQLVSRRKLEGLEPRSTWPHGGISSPRKQGLLSGHSLLKALLRSPYLAATTSQPALSSPQHSRSQLQFNPNFDFSSHS